MSIILNKISPTPIRVLPLWKDVTQRFKRKRKMRLKLWAVFAIVRKFLQSRTLPTQKVHVTSTFVKLWNDSLPKLVSSFLKQMFTWRLNNTSKWVCFSLMCQLAWKHFLSSGRNRQKCFIFEKQKNLIRAAWRGQRKSLKGEKISFE